VGETVSLLFRFALLTAWAARIGNRGRELALSALLVATIPSPAMAQDDRELRAPQGGQVGLELVAEGLSSPLFLTESPDDSGRLFLVDQAGHIRILTQEGKLVEEPFLDISDKLVGLSPENEERGLLGLAFHPDFANNRRFFVYYSAPRRESAPPDWNHTSRLSEFAVVQDQPDAADRGSERIMMEVDLPQANRNGGRIAFGPDGLLYVPLGDGGGAGDVGAGHSPQGNAQDLTNVLGDLLRIDVNGPQPYGIPPDNPFAGRPDVRPEIFAYGFHSPNHISFDQQGSKALFVADAGQDRFAEVSVVARGRNYGWRTKEGTHCFDPNRPSDPPPECPATGPLGEPLIDPVVEYDRLEVLGSSVTGGYVYRGQELPELIGRYVFGDYSRDRSRPDGTLFVASPARGGLWPIQELRPFLESEGIEGTLNHFILGFGQDRAGEVYLLAKEEAGTEGKTGKAFRLIQRQVVAETAAEPEERSLSPVVWVVMGVIVLAVLLVLVRLTRTPKAG
jgi:glucose/arabinose dehydrogenase